MVFGFVILAVSLIFLILASASDLRSREVADEISVGFLISALSIRLVWSLVSRDPAVFLQPFLVGCGFLLGGLAMYYLRQWGGGDLLLFSALGVAFGTLPPEVAELFPRQALFPFWSALLLNLLLAGAAYGSVWILALFLFNPKVRTSSIKRLIKWLPISAVVLVFSVFSLIYLELPGGLLGASLLFLYLVFVCSKSVEAEVFTKPVLPKDLRVEDWIAVDVTSGGRVIVAATTPGLTKGDILKIRRAKLDKPHVLVKEGIPFVPVFLLALLASVALRDPLSLLFLALAPGGLAP